MRPPRDTPWAGAIPALYVMAIPAASMASLQALSIVLRVALYHGELG